MQFPPLPSLRRQLRVNPAGGAGTLASHLGTAGRGCGGTGGDIARKMFCRKSPVLILYCKTTEELSQLLRQAEAEKI